MFLHLFVSVHMFVYMYSIYMQRLFLPVAVFNDNDFEVFVDPDGSTHGYKEIEINAIRTIFDLLMNKV